MSDSFTGQQINASIIRLTAAQWTAQPYVLPAGVIGLESDTGAFKIGDGETAWADLLAYSTPTGVKTYRALLTQTGTDAPVATVLENTLGGTVVWTYSAVGLYTGTLEGAFPLGLTAVSFGFIDWNNLTSITGARGSVDDLSITTMDCGGGWDTTSLANGILDASLGIPFTVYVYPA